MFQRWFRSAGGAFGVYGPRTSRGADLRSARARFKKGAITYMYGFQRVLKHVK